MFQRDTTAATRFLCGPMQALRIAAYAAADWTYGSSRCKDSTTPDGSRTIPRIAIGCHQLRHTQIAVMNKLVSLQ
jgi:hypothetical protein